MQWSMYLSTSCKRRTRLHLHSKNGTLSRITSSSSRTSWSRTRAARCSGVMIGWLRRTVSLVGILCRNVIGVVKPWKLIYVFGDVTNRFDHSDLILSNLLEGLALANVLPKRIFVQYGQKWYGVHLGATSIPDEESDPRLALEPNLYYTQHDLLTAFCSKHNISWNAALPSFVIGAALDSSQSLLFPLLAYASVQKHRNKVLEYPSDLNAWHAPQSLSNAVLNSHMYEWSVLAPNTANQMFNALDDCAFTWGKMWPRLADYFAMQYSGPDTSIDVQWHEKGMKAEPPPHSMGRKSTMRYRFSFVEWAQDPENQAAWRELASKHGLTNSEWKDIGSIFGRADFCLHRPYASIMR